MTAVDATAPTAGGGLPAIVRAMRLYQWPKNLLVFAALAFSAGEAWKLGEPSTWWPLLWRTCLLLALWCLTSSAVYLINDVTDREVDQLHPRKRLRPIASGAVSTRTAKTVAVGLLVVALVPAFVLDVAAGGILAGYAALNMAYSFGLKRIAILDVIILSSGVVGRAVAGAAVIDVTISPWLYVCSSCGAFFFASSKRWAEFRQLGAEAASHRPSLAHYGGEILSQMLVISGSAALLSYALYTIESAHVPRNGAMALTIPFVAFGLFRYLLLLNGSRATDAPDQIVFTDPQIVLAVAGFVVTALGVLLIWQR
jgi:4-hydroxybenzoate polyprenyltransferase